MHINYSEYSSIGGRKKNEDMALIVSYPRSTIAVVADGLGGHGDGDVASRLAAHTISEQLSMDYPGEERLAGAIRKANERILGKQESGSDMKTTVAVLWFGDGAAYAAHVGDSRIYQFRNGRIQYQSVDHSVSQMAALMGDITADQIRYHCDRNRLTRALGAGAAVRMDIRKLDVVSGDAFLICSDGFWEPVLESEMIEDLAHAADAQRWIDAMRVRADARRKADADNSTVIAMMIP